jgi:hypothetical protein
MTEDNTPEQGVVDVLEATKRVKEILGDAMMVSPNFTAQWDQTIAAFMGEHSVATKMAEVLAPKYPDDPALVNLACLALVLATMSSIVAKDNSSNLEAAMFVVGIFTSTHEILSGYALTMTAEDYVEDTIGEVKGHA